MAPIRTSPSTSAVSASALGTELAEIACGCCRDRKLKCSRTLPACEYCAVRELACRYERITRTPLTRKNLDAAEARINDQRAEILQLKSLLASSQNGASTSRQAEVAASLLPPLPPPASKPLHFRLPDESTVSVRLGEQEQPGEDVVPGEVEADGTGSLDLDEGGRAGFLGPVSGAALLRFLQRVCATDSPAFVSPSKPRSQPSPSSSTLSSLLQRESFALYLDSYFTHYHRQYPLLHEPTFRAQLAEVLPRPSPVHWQLLHQVVIAIGSFCMPDRHDHTDCLVLLSRANKLINISLFETSTITGVQAFLLHANLAQKLNRPNLGHVFMGIALRMAMNLGLHREPSPHLPLFEQEARRRLFWTLYCFEMGSILTFGHDCTLPDVGDGARVRPLTNIPEEALTPNATTLPPHVEYATIYSSLQQHSLFHAFANDIIHRASDSPTPGGLLRMDDEVVAWRAGLPSYFFKPSVPAWFEFARERIQWRLDHLRMVVLRPAFLRVAGLQGEPSADLEACWDRCLTSAMSTIQSIRTYIEAVPHRTSHEGFYMNLFLFPAVFVPLIALRTRPQHTQAFEWLLSVQTVVSLLEHVKHNPLAERCSQIITAVVANSHGPRSHDEPGEQQPLPVSSQAPYVSTSDLPALPSNLFPFFGDNALDSEFAASSPASFDALLAQWLAPA